MSDANHDVNQRIELVARAMAKMQGLDPDGRCAPGQPQVIAFGIHRGYAIPTETMAVWQAFVPEAATAVAALECVA